jgi:hypothetical protein
MEPLAQEKNINNDFTETSEGLEKRLTKINYTQILRELEPHYPSTGICDILVANIGYTLREKGLDVSAATGLLPGLLPPKERSHASLVIRLDGRIIIFDPLYFFYRNLAGNSIIYNTAPIIQNFDGKNIPLIVGSPMYDILVWYNSEEAKVVRIHKPGLRLESNIQAYKEDKDVVSLAKMLIKEYNEDPKKYGEIGIEGTLKHFGGINVSRWKQLSEDDIEKMEIFIGKLKEFIETGQSRDPDFNERWIKARSYSPSLNILIKEI